MDLWTNLMSGRTICQVNIPWVSDGPLQHEMINGIMNYIWYTFNNNIVIFGKYAYSILVMITY